MNKTKKVIDELVERRSKIVLLVLLFIVVLAVMSWFVLFSKFFIKDTDHAGVMGLLETTSFVKIALIWLGAVCLNSMFSSIAPTLCQLPVGRFDLVGYLIKRLAFMVILPTVYETLMFFYMMIQQLNGIYAGTQLDSAVKVLALAAVALTVKGILLVVIFAIMKRETGRDKTREYIRNGIIAGVSIAVFVGKCLLEQFILETESAMVCLIAAVAVGAAVWGYCLTVCRKRFLENYSL